MTVKRIIAIILIFLLGVLAWVVLPTSYLLTDPSANINWVRGLGREPQAWMPAPVFLILLMIAFPLVVYLPTHLLLKRLFAVPRSRRC